MADKLSTPDAVFRDSLVTNLSDLCDLIPALNFSGDSELATLAEATRAKLAGIDPQKLRDDFKVRGQIAGEAGALLAQITGAGSRFIDLS
jgi:homoserine kinase